MRADSEEALGEVHGVTFGVSPCSNILIWPWKQGLNSSMVVSHVGWRFCLSVTTADFCVSGETCSIISVHSDVHWRRDCISDLSVFSSGILTTGRQLIRKLRHLTFTNLDIGRVHYNMAGAPGWPPITTRLATWRMRLHLTRWNQRGKDAVSTTTNRRTCRSGAARRCSSLSMLLISVDSECTLLSTSDDNPSAGLPWSRSLETCLFRAAFCLR